MVHLCFFPSSLSYPSSAACYKSIRLPLGIRLVRNGRAMHIILRGNNGKETIYDTLAIPTLYDSLRDHPASLRQLINEIELSPGLSACYALISLAHGSFHNLFVSIKTSDVLSSLFQFQLLVSPDGFFIFSLHSFCAMAIERGRIVKQKQFLFPFSLSLPLLDDRVHIF